MFSAGSVNLRPIETIRASEAIYEQIKEMILTGQLKPGDRLPSERNMMEMLKRSRPTIREALRMLERAGFIKTIPGSNGAVVQELSTKGVEQSIENMLQVNLISLEEMAEYRSLNEVAIAGWAAERCTKEDLDAIDEIMLKAESLVENPSEFILLDPKFHGLIAKAAKNEVAYIITQVFSKLVTDMISSRMEKMPEKGRIGMCNKILLMHQNVVNALHSHDVEAARSAMELHVRAFMQDLAVIDNDFD